MPLACTEPDVKSGMVLLVLYCFHFGGYLAAGRLRMRCRGPVGQRHCNFQVTLFMKQETNPKVVQEQLGHSSISVNLDVYSHVIPLMQELAAKRLMRP